jgi:uncharacterized membrane protein YqjE
VEPQPPPGSGPVASLRALGATLLELIGTRAELALVELREEGERRSRMLALALAGTLFLGLGLLLAALFVVALFWDTHRLAAIGGVTLLYLGIAALAFAILRAKLRASPPPFEATLRELAADRELLRGRRE